jgi:serine/threonine protein phosphatase PrpC
MSCRVTATVGGARQKPLYLGFRTDYGGPSVAAQEEQMPDKQQGVLEYEAAGASDQGRTRKSNEDAYGLNLSNRDGAGNFVVCDGMGGAAAGEIASRLAVDAMLKAMSPEDLTCETFQRAVDAANESVHQSAGQDPSRAGMGTTLVAMATRGNRAWVAHVGDSRCYRLRDGRLERLTHDHSLVDEQVRLGQLTPAQAETSPMRNVITRAVGTQDEVDADLIEFVVAPGDLYLLASDGLMREVDDEQIAGILRHSDDLKQTCAQLIGAANAAGGHDNITCVLARAR